MHSERRIGESTVDFRRWLLGLLSLIAISGYLALFLRICWRIGDEGSILYGAQRVTAGAIPSRDFFEVIGPGAFYWLALWFKVLGTSWMTSRLAILATALGSATAIYYATTRIYRGPFELLPAGAYTVMTIPLWPGANHHFDSNLWILLAFALVVQIPGFGKWVGLVCGVLVGIAATFIPHKAVLMLVAIAAAVAAGRIRDRRGSPVSAGIAFMMAGSTLVGLGVLLFYWLNGALPDLIYAYAIWPAQQYHSVNAVPYAYGLREWLIPAFASRLFAVLPLLLATGGLAAAALPLLCIAAMPILILCATANRLLVAHWPTVRQIWRRRQQCAVNRAGDVRGATAAVVPLVPSAYWYCGFALWLSECQRPDMMHLIYGSPILVVAGVAWLGRRHSGMARAVMRAAVAGIAVIAVLQGAAASADSTAIATRQGTVSMFKDDDALRFIQSHVPDGETIFVYPYYPMYYFLADVRNPTRFSILLYHMNTADQLAEVLRDLESSRVTFVLWDTLASGENLTAWFPNYRPPAAAAQVIERYFESTYTPVAVKSGFRILRRNQSTAKDVHIDVAGSTAGYHD